MTWLAGMLVSSDHLKEALPQTATVISFVATHARTASLAVKIGLRS